MASRHSSSFSSGSPILTKSHIIEYKKPDIDIDLPELYKKLQAHVGGAAPMKKQELQDYFERINGITSVSYRNYCWLLPKIKGLFKHIFTDGKCTRRIKPFGKIAWVDAETDFKHELMDNEESETKTLDLLTNNDFVTPSQEVASINCVPKPKPIPKEYSQDLFSGLTGDGHMSYEQYDLPSTVTMSNQFKNDSIMEEEPMDDGLYDDADSDETYVEKLEKITKEECDLLLEDTDFNKDQSYNEAEELLNEARSIQKDLKKIAVEHRIHSDEFDEINDAILREVCALIDAQSLDKN